MVLRGITSRSAPAAGRYWRELRTLIHARHGPKR
jgi:hypothetical protein